MLDFPEPTLPLASRREVFLSYLEFFRSVLLAKLDDLPDAERTRSRLPSGWTPAELLHHLTHVERRWLVWGFEGEPVAAPWGDTVDGRWQVPDGTTYEDLRRALVQQAARTREVVEAHDLDAVGAPSERWDGADPPTLERVLFHLVQEWARHVGHLDVVRELVDGATGESATS